MKSLGLGALLALSALALAAQAGPLVRKVKAGDQVKYRIKANFELGGNEIVFSGLQSEKVTEVSPDGTYTLESASSEIKVTFGGQEIPIPADQAPPATVSVYNADGSIKEIRGDAADGSAYRMANLSAVLLNAKEAKIGETWTVEKPADAKSGAVAFKSTYKIIGEEKIGAFDTWKLEIVTKESEGDSPASAESTTWIDKADASLVKSDAKLANATFPGAPGLLNGTLTLTRE